jgi:hypothetical protein
VLSGLEVVAVDGDGPAAIQGVRVGMRVSLVNELPATEASFATIIDPSAVGTPIRLLVVEGAVEKPVWVVAGTKAP